MKYVGEETGCEENVTGWQSVMGRVLLKLMARITFLDRKNLDECEELNQRANNLNCDSLEICPIYQFSCEFMLFKVQTMMIGSNGDGMRYKTS